MTVDITTSKDQSIKDQIKKWVYTVRELKVTNLPYLLKAGKPHE